MMAVDRQDFTNVLKLLQKYYEIMRNTSFVCNSRRYVQLPQLFFNCRCHKERQSKRTAINKNVNWSNDIYIYIYIYIYIMYGVWESNANFKYMIQCFECTYSAQSPIIYIKSFDASYYFQRSITCKATIGCIANSDIQLLNYASSLCVQEQMRYHINELQPFK